MTTWRVTDASCTRSVSNSYISRAPTPYPWSRSANWGDDNTLLHLHCQQSLLRLRLLHYYLRWREKATPYNFHSRHVYKTTVTSTKQALRLQNTRHVYNINCHVYNSQVKQKHEVKLNSHDVYVLYCRRDACFVDVTAVNCRVWPFHAPVNIYI